MQPPLGVDIGSTRIRVLHAVETDQGIRGKAVAVRDVPMDARPDFLSSLLEDAWGELGARERRCVCSLGEPDATIRTLALPRMSAPERRRVAQFEAARFVQYPIAEARVRIAQIETGENLFAIGVSRAEAEKARIELCRRAGLRLYAIDYDGCALLRAFPEHSAVLDIGGDRSALHVRTKEAPATWVLFRGGREITRGIERDLAIDESSAEKRKRILGTAGAGFTARSDFMKSLAELVQNARSVHSVDRVAIVGNGARLPQFGRDLERLTGVRCELPVSELLRGGTYPEDVVRNGASDWALAAGLSTWDAA